MRLSCPTNFNIASKAPIHTWRRHRPLTAALGRPIVARAEEPGSSGSLEAQKWFLRRLEDKGWGEARSQLMALEQNSPPQRRHPLVTEGWNAMKHVYGLGVIETPLEPAPWMAEAAGGGATVALKVEAKQVTGSFKARGAAHKMLSLPPTTTHIVTSSTGNHALAVLHAVSSLAARGRKLHATLFVPETISPEKASKLRKAGAAANAEIIATGKDCIEAEAAARVEAERSGGVYISPYNDLQVAAGQGTLAFELLMTIPAGKLDAVFVPVGGGGLMSGVAAVLKAVHPGVTIVGCQPERSDVMKQSVEAGFVVELPWQETLSDGTAGGIESDSVTLEYCSEFVDEWVTVSEKEIASAMVQVAGHHAMNVEGAAGVAVASYLKRADRWSGKHAVVVCCGGNVAAESLERAYEIAGHHHSVSASGSRDFL